MVDGPFVYRLGPQVFILVRGVRLPYGLQKEISNLKSLFFYIFNHKLHITSSIKIQRPLEISDPSSLQKNPHQIIIDED